MNLTVDIRAKIYSSVVPVRCGSKVGTAFFITPDTLLTARHIITDYVESEHAEKISISVGKQIFCEPEFIAEEGVPIDVILLRSIDFKNENLGRESLCLNLLADNFNLESKLAIVGYPEEFGKNENLISLDVLNRIEVQQQDYDRTVVRKDSLEFTSYSGFSGSPVINEKGSVIGIALEQQNQGIGYLSIRKISDLLRKKNIDVSEDWQSEDFSPLGRGTSQRQVEEAVNYASVRYNRDLHVANKDRDQDLDIFCGYGVEEQCRQELSQLEADAIEFYGITIEPKSVGGYNLGKYVDLPDALYAWATKNHKKNFRSYNYYQETDAKVKKILREWSIAGQQRAIIHASAGCGKTHYMCYTAERLSKKMNVYLLFGSRFSGDKDFSSQLTAMMDIGNHSLSDLNERLISSKENALIIIDAINEGAGDSFWKTAVRQIESKFSLFRNIKFILTYREGDSSLNFDGWEDIVISGFGENRDEAIEKYFSHYDINDEDNSIRRKYRTVFNEPLFLSIFCQTFHDISSGQLKDITYSLMFRLYIYRRNEVVSVKVDEDPYRNVTYKFLEKIANYSLYYADCSHVPRKKARQYADQICRWRPWSKNLLHCVLNENLLIETGSTSDSVMFAFQKMGDFLMADIFASNKMADEEKINYVIKVGGWAPYRRFVSALISDWNLTPRLLKEPLKRLGGITPSILESVRNHGLNHALVIDWLADNRIISTFILHDYFEELPLKYFEKIHDIFLKLNLAKRDEVWSSQVNKLYLEYKAESFSNFIDVVVEEDNESLKKYTIFLCWMSTSSYPIIRKTVTRRLTAFFEKHYDMIRYAINKFRECDDPYVMQVITCAVYGCLLRKRDADFSHRVASILYDSLFSNGSSPADIIIRQWSLLIFQFSDYLNNTQDFTDKAKPPFKLPNPYTVIKDRNIETNEKYFGENNGSWRMFETLFGFSDFKRYILGSNSRSESSVFFQKDKEGNLAGLPLQDIQMMIANIAKHDLGWNDNLGELDKGIESKGRYNNKEERFGKKYLWLALYRVDAMMADNYYVAKDSFGGISNKEDLAQIPYPWYTEEYSHLDPSILSESDTYPETLSSPNFISVKGVPYDTWLSQTYPIDNPRLILGDNGDWIVLTCYDGYEVPEEDETVKDFFLFTNAAFVRNGDLKAYNDWAKDQNFYGRWMPERRNGSIDHLWNEYPWADTYKRTEEYDENLDCTPSGCPVHISLSYESQLQEEWGDLNEDNIGLREVVMPNNIMMEQLGLYTAERGIIRDLKKPEIKAAVNFEMDRLRGLAIRRDYLQKFLNRNNYSLVYYTLGEKYVHRRKDYHNVGYRHNLSGAYFYNDKENKVETVQSIHIVESYPKAQ